MCLSLSELLVLLNKYRQVEASAEHMPLANYNTVLVATSTKRAPDCQDICFVIRLMYKIDTCCQRSFYSVCLSCCLIQVKL